MTQSWNSQGGDGTSIIAPVLYPDAGRGHSRVVVRTAITLVEVMVSLVVVSLLALSIAAMLSAAGYGTDGRREVRRVAVHIQQVRVRVDDAVRTAKQILDSGQTSTDHGYLVLWRGDTNITGANAKAVNLSELQLIELANGSTVLTSYLPATGVADEVYADSFYQHSQNAKSNGKMVATPWANNVTGFNLVLNNATPTDASMVTWRATCTDGDLTEQIVGSTTLR